MNYFLRDMLERAIKTFLEAAVATLGVVLVIDDMPWVAVLIYRRWSINMNFDAKNH